jgi:nucleoporin NDC1
MLARIVTVLATSAIMVSMGIAAHAVLFLASKLVVLPLLFKLPFVPRLLRPFLAHFLRGPWPLSLLTRNGGLVFRAWTLGFMTILSWEFAESMFDSVVVEVRRTTL